MANEITKVTDQNGADHPFKDVAAFPRSEQAVLGAKNLIPFPYTHSLHLDGSNGISVSVGEDGSITLTGTATADTWIIPIRTESGGNFRLVNGTNYKLSGCPTGGDNTKYKLYLTDGDDNNVVLCTDYGNGAEFIANSHRISVVIQIYNGFAIPTGGITFKPMIRLASDPDDTYVPHAMTNKELTNSKMSWEANRVLGSHNLFPLSEVYATSALLEKISKGFRVYNTTARQYATVVTPIRNMGLINGVKYKISVDAEVTSGHGAFGLRKSNSMLSPSVWNISQSGHYELVFTYDSSDSVSIDFLCTIDTSETGDITFNNVLLTAEADTDTTYSDFVMNNIALSRIALAYKRTLTSADNMNDLNEAGIYQVEAGTNLPQNLPSGYSYREIIILPETELFKMQIILNNDAILIRKFTKGNVNTWTSWYKFEGTAVS